ncbi:MAG: type I DNA topoisomerase [Armatimonadetes bacterium]|nr:type I DNA topoisomerase [Armatimonadota bacterium]
MSVAAKKAIIVESPTKTRTLAKFLGDDYKLLASSGHVRDLPEDGLAVDIERDFEPTYVVTAKKTISSLKKNLKDVDEVYLATDPDREGEAIAWHLREALNLEDPRRITFNEITEEAVSEALKHPGEIDMALVDAQQARRILDRIVGYQLSPLLSRRIAGNQGAGLSAGRVQSVALRLVCDRERERLAFEPEEYWSITVTLTPEDGGQPFEAELKTIDGEEHGLASEDDVKPVVAELEQADYRVAEIEKKQVRRNPPAPFRTSTLQQAAANRLRFSSRKTMTIAQQLYEGVETDQGTAGLITYMRTDSTRIAASARAQAVDFIKRQYGEKFVGPGARGKQAKGAQDAHEAIRPTSTERTPERMARYLDKDQLALYELIWRRFVASQMAPAVMDQTGVNIEAGRCGLRATGSVVIFPGFLRVAGRNEDDDKLLPELEEGQELKLLGVEPEQHFTQPPPRFTEATLVRELEANGIGRPSTYASIIETLRQRRYVRMEKRQFVPTPLGFAVNDYLMESFPEIMDIEFTAGVEEQLDTIESGERDWVSVLRDFYGPFSEQLEQVEKAPPKVLEGESCPKCGGKLLVRYSRHGKFAGCENYPECDYTRDLTDGAARQEPEETDYTCPECGKPLVIRTGRRGRFFACTGYPECRYTADVGEDGAPVKREQPQSTGETCPECGDGVLLIRTGRRGKFLGCSNYPRCRYTRDWDGEQAVGEARPPADSEGEETAPSGDEVAVTCDECGAPMKIRTGKRGRFLGCSRYPQCRGTKPISAAIEAGWEPPQPEKLDEECPECGKPLVVREGKRGKFIGCSGYPKCRYTRDFDEKKEETGSD